MSSLAHAERLALADLLTELGPDAPTLCEGWDTRALAAHLAIRERRPDATPGVAVKALAGWTESVQKGYEKQPYDALVRLVRTGPGRLSPFALPFLDRLLNTTEYAVHHEDVRRAQPHWRPRRLPPDVQDALWAAVRTQSGRAFRKLEVGVVLVRADVVGSSVVAAKGEPVATVTGDPMELLLFLFGRREQSRVEVSGDPAAVTALAAAELAV